jgi:hypothetical protein
MSAKKAKTSPIAEFRNAAARLRAEETDLRWLAVAASLERDADFFEPIQKPWSDIEHAVPDRLTVARAINTHPAGAR